MKVICMHAERRGLLPSDLTEGEQYEATETDTGMLKLKSDRGRMRIYDADRFQTLSGVAGVTWTAGEVQQGSGSVAVDTAVANQALRFDAGKPELHYVDMFPLALAEVSRTLMYGTQRKREPYPRFNWCKGAPFLQLYNCARRHMLGWFRGETNDKQASEDGWEINNLAFTCGNLLRLLEQELAGKTKLDDRYKP